MEKLNGSHTPAWRNLRGRDGAAKKQSYFEGPEDEEDELADQPSEEEEAAAAGRKKGSRGRAAAVVKEEEEEDESSEVRTRCISFASAPVPPFAGPTDSSCFLVERLSYLLADRPND